jgi:Tol biopolymer transport system component
MRTTRIGPAFVPYSISGDGRLVAFSSAAPKLTARDDNETYDVFVRNLSTSTTSLVSRASGADGPQGNGWSGNSVSLTADGRFVLFESGATNLTPDGLDGGVFVRELGRAA